MDAEIRRLEAAAPPPGNIVVNVDGSKLLGIMQSQIYRYNIRKAGDDSGEEGE